MTGRDKTLNVAVLIACHNRRESTKKSLLSFMKAKPHSWNIEFFLVDDGSTDGTSESVLDLNLKMTIIRGNGTWYWARSMYEAEIASSGKFDALFWLNDDVEMFENGLLNFEELNQKYPSAILVGQTRSRIEGNLTYGTYVKYDAHPFHLKHIQAISEPLEGDAFNGNLVLIPKTVSKRVGTIDGRYDHAYADIDFGYRAKKLGIQIFAVPGFSGICDVNIKTELNSVLKFFQLFQKKKLPVRSQKRFLIQHGGRFWYLYLVAPYLKGALGIKTTIHYPPQRRKL